MKTNKVMALTTALLTALAAGIARAFQPQGVDANNTAGTHGAEISRSAEGPLGAHLLLTFGTLPGKQVKLCTATTRPLGFAYDEAGDGELVGVELLSAGKTRLGIASKAIAAGVRVYATAGGKLTDAVVSGAYLVGESLTATGADGEEIEIMPLSPVANA